MRHEPFLFARASSLLALLVASGCTATPTPTRFANLGELHDAIEEALASPDGAIRRDSDADGIPDGIEDDLETDPDVADTDRDGLVDNAELFGLDGDYDRLAPIPDADHDGIIAPNDDDDDGDGRHDGESIDSDGDGIANYLEYYGYRFDWLTGAFVAWDGDDDVEHFRTDPLQFSTDQDAYSDAMEVTGVDLDVTVLPPGNHPLVPAIPNVVLEVMGYSITLNEEITYGESRTLENETTWNRETESSHSYTDESNWEVGIEGGYAGGSGHFLAHANYGESYSSTQTTSTSIASGGSVLEGSEWSAARTTNPTEAARIKLFVRVHNRGAAPVSAVVPTLSLRIGGLNVATFQPGNGQANMLVPGGAYPEDPSVAWVIDSVATEGGSAPLMLTMRELRALESGAPLSLTVTQLLGDVVRLNDEEAWESVGDVNQYLARCDAVGANVRFDLGDGTFVHHLVYADDAPSGVPMTLGDAMTLLGVGEADVVLHWSDANGTPRSTSLDGYSYVIDQETLRRNGWVLDAGSGPAVPPDGFALEGTRLYPGTNVLVRAPRETLGDTGPTIHFAYADPTEGEVRVCTTDYQGIASVVLRNSEGDRELPLQLDLEGACYYSLDVSPEVVALGEEGLSVRVTNLRGDVVEQPLGQLFVQPGPRLPIINDVRLDLASKRIYANVVSGAPDDPASEIEWVRVYHTGLPDGFLDMGLVPNDFEDPNGHEATLPTTFARSDVEVVAYVAPGVYARHRVTPTEVVRARVAGVVHLGASIDTTGEDEEWWVPYFDADSGVSGSGFIEADGWNDAWNPPLPYDIWIRVDEGATAYAFFNAAWSRIPTGTDFGALTQATVSTYAFDGTAPLALNAAEGLQVGDMLALRTAAGHYAKLRVISIPTAESGWTNWYARTLVIEYLTWD